MRKLCTIALVIAAATPAMAQIPVAKSTAALTAQQGTQGATDFVAYRYYRYRSDSCPLGVVRPYYAPPCYSYNAPPQTYYGAPPPPPNLPPSYQPYSYNPFPLGSTGSGNFGYSGGYHSLTPRRDSDGGSDAGTGKPNRSQD